MPGEGTALTGTTAALISAGAATTTAAGSIGASAISTRKSRKFAKEMYAKQRADSLQDTADSRAYAQQMYDMYESPLGKKKAYMAAGFSPTASIGESSSFQPPAAMPNSDTSGVIGADASLTTSHNANITAAMSQLDPLSYFQAQNLLEDARSKKMYNDQLQKENDAKDSILDMSTSPDDFPQLYHYDQGWFNRAAKRLGHQPTFRDMMTMAIAKQYVHQANATAGHHHDNGLSGYQFEQWTYGYSRDDNFSNGRRPYSEDGDLSETMFAADIARTLEDCIVENSNRGKKLNLEAISQDLENEWNKFYYDNQKDIERAYRHMRQVDADYYVAEKWLEMIQSGSESLSNIVDMIPTKKVANIVSRSMGNAKPINGKPVGTPKLPKEISPRPTTKSTGKQRYSTGKLPDPRRKPQKNNRKTFDFGPYE